MEHDLRYINLRDNIISSCRVYFTNGAANLDIVKSEYAEDVHSVRKLDRVDTLDGFIKLMEMLDLLSAENVRVLKSITTICQEGELFMRIKTYKSLPSSMPVKKIAVATDPSLHSNTDPNKKRACFELIIIELGDSWKEMARRLGIREGDIDDIEYLNSDMREQIRKMLRMIEDSTEPRCLRTILEHGLREARRNDLANRIAKIYDTY